MIKAGQALMALNTGVNMQQPAPDMAVKGIADNYVWPPLAAAPSYLDVMALNKLAEKCAAILG